MTHAQPHEVQAVPPGTGVAAVPDMYSEVHGRTFGRMAAMAGRFSLPDGKAWLAARGDDRVSGLEAFFENDLPERRYARVGIIASEAHARDVTRGFGLAKRAIDRDGWDPDHFLNRFYADDESGPEVRTGAEVVAVHARRARSPSPEGFLLCRRDLTVSGEPGERLTVEYTLHGEYAYVVPKARGRGLSAALVIAVGNQVALDLAAIREVLKAVPARQRPTLETRVCGEAHSQGGLWVLDRLVDTIEVHCDLDGLGRIGCTPDYSL